MQNALDIQFPLTQQHYFCLNLNDIHMWRLGIVNVLWFLLLTLYICNLKFPECHSQERLRSLQGMEGPTGGHLHAVLGLQRGKSLGSDLEERQTKRHPERALHLQVRLTFIFSSV